MNGKSTIELRVLPSFDPRIKLLVEMMAGSTSKYVAEKGASESEKEAARNEINEALDKLRANADFTKNLKQAQLMISVVPKEGALVPKTEAERRADFLDVAARIIAGKHPAFVGWVALTQKEISTQMRDYIDFFYGNEDPEAKPGSEWEGKITALIAEAGRYFDKLLSQQGKVTLQKTDRKFGLESIEAFITAPNT